MENKKLDLREVEALLKQSTRPKIQLILQNFKQKVEQEIKELEKIQQIEQQKQLNKDLQYEGIKKYSWDQEGSKITIYINMENVAEVGQDNLQLDTTKESLDLKVLQYKGKNFRLNLKKLGGEILQEKSKFRLKQNYIVITLIKKQSNNWGNIYYEKKFDAKESVKKNQDPQAGLMDMMKKMYDEGDDNMKRTIAEAWTKAQDKKSS